MSTPIHDAAARGFQIAGDSYERGRPEYPKAAMEYLTEVLRLGPSRSVLDVGAGTGKFTKLLLQTRAHVIAVEPVEGMRLKLAALLPDCDLRAGAAEHLPIDDAALDAAVAAQAFHWFEGEQALAELHRVLKPGGRLALVWNARDESVEWVARLTEIIDPHENGAPRYRSGLWRRPFGNTRLFGPLTHRCFGYLQKGDTQMLLDRVGSISFISALPEADRQVVLTQVRQLASSLSTPTIELPYRTDVYWCERR